MSEHTKEPWYVGAQNDSLYITAGKAPAPDNDSPNHDADRTVIAKMLGDNFAISMPNARRIVACVNGCAGIPTDALEQKTVVVSHDYNLANIKQQRDELLAALSELEEYARGFSVSGVYLADEIEGSRLLKNACAAIAKEKGGAA